MHRIPSELKIPFIQMENIFFPIDKFLKIEEVEYLIHYVKFKMWSVPIFTQRLKTGILIVALGCTFQFFQIDER